jgi:hypothetical protein
VDVGISTRVLHTSTKLAASCLAASPILGLERVVSTLSQSAFLTSLQSSAPFESLSLTGSDVQVTFRRAVITIGSTI